MAGPQPRREPLPAVDERIVREGSRAEIVRGELFMTPPADEPHGNRHIDLAYVLRAHVAVGFSGAVDMLTRTSDESDFAPDASIYPSARDPRTGRRQLEVMAFEIASEQWIGVPSEKARELARRGVRRVFCIVLKTERVLEWSRDTDGWRVLPADGTIDDECLARPLPVRALLDGSVADGAVIDALRARGALSVIEREALVTRIRDACELLDIALDADREARIARLDEDGLAALLADLKRARRWPR